jgi:hypothetical protein
LFSGALESAPEPETAPAGPSAADLSERIGRLEEMMEQMRAQVAGLAEALKGVNNPG